MKPYSVAVTIRLVLAEDNYLVREGVRQLIETQPDLQVVAIYTDLDSLLAAVETHRPDVVVTDIRMPPTGTDKGIRAAERLRQQHPIWSEPVPGIPATLKALVTDDELPVAGRLLE